MEFGKLSSVDQVDFGLPPDPPDNAGILQKNRSDQGATPMLYIGATGWSVKEWVGKIYPAGTKPQDYLSHYARYFNTIELNTTHYRIPDLLTVQHWHDQAAAGFKFCPKVLQTVSHATDLGVSGGLIGAFCQSMQGLGEKLGPCFIQLPPYFAVERMNTLEAFLKAFHLPLAVEVRHESWFANPLIANKFFHILAKNGVGTVVTDVAGRRDVCHMRITAGFVMIRFVGNNLHPTDYSRIDEWVKRLKIWFDEGLSAAYFFTHEPDNLLAPDLAAYLATRAREAGLSVCQPMSQQNLNKAGKQMSLF